MRPLNPFLQAFFSSKLPSQCLPRSQYVLLIPTTELLLTHRDRDTQTSYHELATSEELLACHVLRAPAGAGLSGRDGAGAPRDSKAKAKQYSTINGRTVVIKDSAVYTNKGFKSLVYAKLLQDVIYYQDAPDSPQWLIYYISRPLVGEPELLDGMAVPEAEEIQHHGARAVKAVTEDVKILHFTDLMLKFPVVARQVWPGLDKLFHKTRLELELINLDAAVDRSTEDSTSEAPPRLHRRTESASSTLSLSSRVSSMSKYASHEATWEENQMRRAIESLVVASIDLFQTVDKQQLSLLGSSTGLSGSTVERMIERHVVEHYHSDSLFPRLCGLMEPQDSALETSIRQMVDVDVSQVGITISNGQAERLDLASRLDRAVQAFRKMNTAQSPHDMLDSLLETQKCLSETSPAEAGPDQAEKHERRVAFSADMLVSLLLIVVIRSPVRHLQARLAYIRDFLFVTDVDIGENGYALSTYEAVLNYLSHHSSGLKIASRANRALWSAAKQGDIAALRRILEADDSAVDLTSDLSYDGHHLQPTQVRDDGHANILLQGSEGLGHVFPFAAPREEWSSSPDRLTASPDTAVNDENPLYSSPNNFDDSGHDRPKLKKKVSMDARTMSSSSARSYLSGSSTLLSAPSMMGETTAENLVQTQDAEGRSALFMVVENGHVEALKYLFGLQDLFSANSVMEDCNNQGSTVLAAAVQTGNEDVIVALLNWLIDKGTTRDDLQQYFARQDTQKRCIAHYLFNCWWLAHWLDARGLSLPWKLKDKNGQTPVFALCRSWDQDSYYDMVLGGLRAAARADGQDGVLYLDDHTDARGNSLLHITHDPHITRHLLYSCNADPNWFNGKHLTPLMVASKFARIEQIRILFGDARVDLLARDHRGLTAVELAKDDEVRNKIDDLLLLSAQARAGNERTTTIVRSFFVDDGSVRFIIKSAAPNGKGTITVTTCRRSLAEFEALSKWLLLEHPASWMPSVAELRSPFQLPSKPSRAALRDMQLRLDLFLKELLGHPTFETHEMLWEFFLVPDLDMAMLADRAQRKAEARVEKLREEYEPLIHSVPEVEAFIRFARDQVSGVQRTFKSVLRRVNAVRNVSTDLFDAHVMVSHQARSSLSFLPRGHLQALSRHMGLLQEAASSPLADFQHTMLSALSATAALQLALSRPGSIIGSMAAAREQLLRHSSQAQRSQRWPSALGLLEDTRSRLQQDSRGRVDRAAAELDTLARELRYTQTTVVGELAGWQGTHQERLRRALREWARQSVTRERLRLDGMRRALRGLRQSTTEEHHQDGGL